MGITKDIYLELDIEKALSNLNPILSNESEGRVTYKLDCPKCSKNRAYIYKGSGYIMCNRENECRYESSIFDYYTEHLGVQQSDVLSTLNNRCTNPLPLESLNRVDYDKDSKQMTRETLFEIASRYFKESLNESEEAREFLKKRGFLNPKEYGLNLGYNKSTKGLRDYLVNNVNNKYQGNIEDTVKVLSQEGRIAIFCRDHMGRIIGFIFRAIDQSKSKYLYTEGCGVGSQLFNIHSNKNEDYLIITEGQFDSVLLESKGLKGFVSTGGSSITGSQLNNVTKQCKKLTQIILSPDTDNAGIAGARKSFKLISNKAKGIKTFVIELPKKTTGEEYKDIGEYLVGSQDVRSIERVINSAVSGGKWLGKVFLSEHTSIIRRLKDKTITDMERASFIKKAIDYGSFLNRDDANYYIELISSHSGIPIETIGSELELHAEMEEKKNKDEATKNLKDKTFKLLREDNVKEVYKLFTEDYPKIEQNSNNLDDNPYDFNEFIEDIRQEKQGLKTGFDSIDNKIKIQRGAITIVAGRTSHGKTTFLLNLLLNLSENNEGKRFYLFSYEETRSQIVLKLLVIMSGVQLDQYRNLDKIKAYLREGKTDNPSIEEAKKRLESYLRSGILCIEDKSFYVDDLTKRISHINDKYDVGGVLIDYIQKIKVRDSSLNRQMDIQRISSQILEASKETNLPIILGAQLNRAVAGARSSSNADNADADKPPISLSNLRECGDIEQDANLVLGLWNESMNGESENTSASTTLRVIALKNRGGETGGNFKLNFNRPILKLEEPKAYTGYFQQSYTKGVKK